MAPPAVVSPMYGGAKALGFSKYASPAQQNAQLAAAPPFPATASATADTTIATKQQIAALAPTHATPPTIDLAVEQDISLQKEVQDHITKFSRVVSNAVTNTHQLLSLLRKATSGSEVLDKLWQELEQLFEAANGAKVALPEFMEKQRDNMSLYHSSMMNETIRDSQEELRFQHKKVSTQQNLILEQQDAFQDYKMKTASKLNELEGLHERVSRLTLEKGNFRTEVDKFKELLEKETARKKEDSANTDALQEELESLVASKKQLQADNETLRKTTAEMLEQLKNTEHRLTERFGKELAMKAEELQKESAKTLSLSTLISTLKSGESVTKKELDKVKNENRLLSVKYTNQAAEHAAAFSKMNEQTKKIETLTVDVDRLRTQNFSLQSKAEDAVELTKVNVELSKAKEAMAKQLDSVDVQLKEANDKAKFLQTEVAQLKLELDTNGAAPVAKNDKALLDKVKALEEKSGSLEVALADWTQLAKRSYKEYKDTLVKLQDAEKYRQEAPKKEAQIVELQKQLAAAQTTQSNGNGAINEGNSAYWKHKYDTLLSSI